MQLAPTSVMRGGQRLSYQWFGRDTAATDEKHALQCGADEFIQAITRGVPQEYEPSLLAHMRGEYRSILRRAIRGQLRPDEVHDTQNRHVEPLYEIRSEIEPLRSKVGHLNHPRNMHIRHYHSELPGYTTRAVGHVVAEKTIHHTDQETIKAQDLVIDQVKKLHDAFIAA